MNLRVGQDFRYLAKDRWKWSAWIDADPLDLDLIESVTWILHPSFPESVVTATERSTAFRLTAAGWGTFLLRARIALKDASSIHLSHPLRLEYPTTDLRSPEERPVSCRDSARVYLSYSAADRHSAHLVRSELRALGIEVVDATTVEPGGSIAAAAEQHLREADAVVAVVGPGEPGPWILGEMHLATLNGKPTLAIVPPGRTASQLPSAVHQVEWQAGNSLPLQQLLGIVDRGRIE